MIVPPFEARLDASLLQNESTVHNGISSPNDSTAREVSWQSACWPVIACVVTVMMQSTGRVLGADSVTSAALRASPLVCMLDTVMMIAEFICLLNVGCSITTAARHVWYGRFKHGSARSTCNLPPASIQNGERSGPVSNSSEVLTGAHLVAVTAFTSDRCQSLDITEAPTLSADISLEEGTETPYVISHRNTTTLPIERGAAGVSSRRITPSQVDEILKDNYLPGSSVDHNWRQSMFAFVLGAAPQALKILAMRGIPVTQVLISTYIIAFLVPELFRLTAESAGLVELRPMPFVSRTKRIVTEVGTCISSWAAMAPAFTFHILFAYLCLPQKGHVAIQMWLFFWPISIVPWVLVQILVRLSRPHALASPLAGVTQRWAVGLQKFIRKMPHTVMVVARIAIYTVMVALYLSIWCAFHFMPLIVTFMVIPLLRESAHSSVGSLDALPPDLLRIYFLKISLGIIFALVTLPLMILVPYGMLFASPLSKITRRLTGIKGSDDELIAGYMTLNSLFMMFYMYNHLWTPEGTYRPAWTDCLG